jgi:putative component of toxin-antitoxin plasmid stabilization module
MAKGGSKRGAPRARPAKWTVEYYVTASGTPVLDWLKKLPEAKRAAWLAFVDFALVPMGKDIQQSGYVKPLGEGLFELRIDHDVAELAQVFGVELPHEEQSPASRAEGILLRVFCTFHREKIVLLLSGLDKGADPKAQPRAIRAARKLLGEWQAEQVAARSRGEKGRCGQTRRWSCKVMAAGPSRP